MASAAGGPYAAISKELPGDEADDVLFSSLYGVRTVELNRPKKLNSLNGSMVRKIMPRLKEWEKSQMANIIIMSGAGEKALCAGGDVAALAQQNKKGKEGQQESSDYFKLEYQLDHLIATYSKPYIAIMDGITMGGGVGLSVHAPFRIATEKTVFAMPETTIGFFPDVGGSFFLSRLDGEIGTYLALTSERLLGVQAFYAGIATHYLDSSVLAPLTTRLSELVFQDHAPLMERLILINSTISEFCSSLPSPSSYPKAKHGDISGPLREAVDRCFKFDTIEDILAALEREKTSGVMSEWAEATLETIHGRSPTSLKVTLRLLRVGKDWDISEAFIREHALATKFMAHGDFVEGVSARLIIKPPTTPQWNPSELSKIKASDVNAFFTSAEGPQMQLLEPAPGALDQEYLEYPHAGFSLPTESAIEGVVQSHGANGSQAVLSEISAQWGAKEGVKEKVTDVLARKTKTQGDKVVWQHDATKL